MFKFFTFICYMFVHVMLNLLSGALNAEAVSIRLDGVVINLFITDYEPAAVLLFAMVLGSETADCSFKFCVWANKVLA